MLLEAKAAPRDITQQITRLRKAQKPDGSFGDPGPNEPRYLHYHSTMMALWAIAAFTAEKHPN